MRMIMKMKNSIMMIILRVWKLIQKKYKILIILGLNNILLIINSMVIQWDILIVHQIKNFNNLYFL